MPPDHLSHGFPYERPPRHNELTDGVPSAEQAAASAERKSGGARIPKGATIVPSLGGKAHKGKTYLSHNITSPVLAPPFKPT